jgi:AcrR family transcriptional regulator
LRKGLDKEKVLQTAIRLVDQLGMEKVTLALLAKELGVRSPSLYNHFRGLQEIRREIALYSLREMEEMLLRSLVGKSGEEAIREFCHVYYEYSQKHPGLYQASLIVYEDPEVQQAGDRIIELLLELLQPFKMEETQCIHIIRGLRSIIHGFSTLKQQGAFGLDVQTDDSFSFSINLYLRSIKKANSES